MRKIYVGSILVGWPTLFHPNLPPHVVFQPSISPLELVQEHQLLAGNAIAGTMRVGKALSFSLSLSWAWIFRMYSSRLNNMLCPP